MLCLTCRARNMSGSQINPSRKKRKVEKISLQTKIEIIQEVAKGVKVVDLATRYGEWIVLAVKVITIKIIACVVWFRWQTDSQIFRSVCVLIYGIRFGCSFNIFMIRFVFQLSIFQIIAHEVRSSKKILKEQITKIRFIAMKLAQLSSTTFSWFVSVA